MAHIDLAYGDSVFPLEFNESQFRSLSLEENVERPLSDAEIGKALDSPIAGPPLEEMLNAGDSILLVVSDATRATGSAQIVNLLVRRIIQHGISPPDIAIIFATGIHRRVTAAEKEELLTPFIAQRIRTIDHDPENEERLVLFDDTSRGTPVRVNRALTEFTHVILVGGIAFHYFAGFTGGRKSICPGLAAAETIRATHMLALDFKTGGRRAGVGTALLDGNPIHLECDLIAEKIGPSFCVNSIVDERGRVVSVLAGHWRESHRKACERYLTGHSIAIPEKRKVVIASCGGRPYDINFIQAHKTLDMASYACEEGGTIILLAECSEGLGRSDFLKWFESGDSSALEQLLHETYEVNGQTAWALLTKAEAFKVVVVSQLPPEQVRKMRMVPAESLDEALSEFGPDASGYIMPRGAAFLPILGAA
ncbi:MAG TPA: nickel-dependent lactate racemase [Pyrinomonadaceae bacterium]